MKKRKKANIDAIRKAKKTSYNWIDNALPFYEGRVVVEGNCIICTLPVLALWSNQKKIAIEKLERVNSEEPLNVALVKNHLVLINGNHRANKALRNGQSVVKCHVFMRNVVNANSCTGQMAVNIMNEIFKDVILPNGEIGLRQYTNLI